MKLRIASDLHLEWRVRPHENLDEAIPKALSVILPPDELDFESTLLLAGDITSYPAQRLAALRVLVPRFRHVFYIKGNHESYGGDISSWWTERELLRQTFGNKLTVSSVKNCEEYVNQGVRILGCTLWARFGVGSPVDEMRMGGMSDFALIKYGGVPLTPKNAAALHEVEAFALKQALERPRTEGEKIVVATHYLPSFALCNPKYGHTYDGAFASNQDELLSKPLAPDLWVHGHTHTAIDRFLGDTRVVCNPKGYPNEEYQGYKHHLFIDV